MYPVASMILEHPGYCHGDPHPGNILIAPSVKRGIDVSLVDWGQISKVEPAMRYDLANLIVTMTEPTG